MEGNAYYLPNDPQECERLDILHIQMRTLWNSNILAPIRPRPSLILDIGTGSGSWVIEVAELYSTARVIGIDLSPIQPLIVPSNAEFQIGDLTVDLEAFHQMSFDFIHSRLVKLGVQEWQWDRYVGQVFHLLKPDVGWAQFGETSDLLGDDAIPHNRPFYVVSCLRITRLTKVSKTPPCPSAEYKNPRRRSAYHRTNEQCGICRRPMLREDNILW